MLWSVTRCFGLEYYRFPTLVKIKDKVCLVGNVGCCSKPKLSAEIPSLALDSGVDCDAARNET